VSKNLLVNFTTGAVEGDSRASQHVVRAVRQAPLPQPLDCGTTTKCVFLTSKVSTANLGGLAGADATCNDLAENAGLPGTYVAWLSDDDTDAISRITSNGPYATRTGRIVANDLADLTDLTLASPISQDEYGNEVPLREVWTDRSVGLPRALELQQLDVGRRGRAVRDRRLEHRHQRQLVDGLPAVLRSQHLALLPPAVT
jgi:hypothetical protein